MPSSSKRSANESSTSSPPHKRRRSSSSNSYTAANSDAEESPLNVFLLDAKMKPETIEELSSIIDNFRNVDKHLSLKEKSGSSERELHLCPNMKDADVVITVVHMRKRLERHVDWSIARQKAIVTPQWLRDSADSGHLLPCGKYAALGDLYQETVQNCPDGDSSQTHPDSNSNSESHDQESESFVPPVPKNGTDIRHNHRYACMRYSPLTCPNQILVEKIAILRRCRELEGLDMQALSYERAISVLKAFPCPITSDNIHEISELPHIGNKIYSKIQEFVQHGDISECKSILSETRYQSLVDLTTVYGIGPATARKLYSSGLRTIKDLEKHYEVTPKTSDDIPDSLNPEHLRGTPTTGLPQLSIKVGLALREEFSLHITRNEVEEIHDVVMNELANIRSGCVSTITGAVLIEHISSYRRGKDKSNDIDIVISHKDLKSEGGQVKGLCAELVKRLYDKGLVTHVMHLSSFREHNALRTSHWDSLEKALTVFKLPDQQKRHKHVHRRLDLVFAAPEVYWTAVVGWTGSRMFERDLKLWAKQEDVIGIEQSWVRGMKFDSSGMQVARAMKSDLQLMFISSSRRHDSKLYFPKSEEEVFKLLRLEWIDPTLRNADI
ncbi:DNA polymerase mu [Lentinula guzmanii]|uniref:DNA polymerase mu n=1 Tax=Lentinula guzmanii TaxID=2804957 RepID=A0AA38JKB8_9AGAR|nr:DNA polymerase mu [Lentinula guzmanii]